MRGSRAAGEGIVAGEDLYFCRGNVGGLELLAAGECIVAGEDLLLQMECVRWSSVAGCWRMYCCWRGSIVAGCFYCLPCYH